MSPQTTDLFPREVAARLRVSVNKILTWIRNGRLKAFNVAKDGSAIPRYRVRLEDLNAFIEKQAITPPPKVSRRQRTQPGVTEYFCESEATTLVRLL